MENTANILIRFVSNKAGGCLMVNWKQEKKKKKKKQKQKREETTEIL